jgi:predicted methyltransferase
MIRNREELAACRSEYSEGRFRGPAKMRLLMDSLESAFERIAEAEQGIFNISDKPRLAFPSYAKLIEVAELQGYCEFPEGFELEEKSCEYIEQNEREAISFLLKEGFEVVYNGEIHFTV